MYSIMLRLTPKNLPTSQQHCYVIAHLLCFASDVIIDSLVYCKFGYAVKLAAPDVKLCHVSHMFYSLSDS